MPRFISHMSNQQFPLDEEKLDLRGAKDDPAIVMRTLGEGAVMSGWPRSASADLSGC